VLAFIASKTSTHDGRTLKASRRETMTQTTNGALADQKLVEECVRAATLAPSIYNSQPWRFRAREGRIDVLADRVRALPAIDPDGREMHISLGAAVFNIEVVLTARGSVPEVALLPDSGDPDLVASVSSGGAFSPTLHDVVLVSALTRRRTVRKPYDNQPLDQVLVDSLAAAARPEGADFPVLDSPDAEALLALVRTADHHLRSEPGYRAELASWTSDDAKRQDGVLPESFGSPSVNDAIPLRDFGAYQPWHRQSAEQYEERPTIAVLSTAGDTPEDWLRAGLALERVLLEATIAGLSASFLTQPLEVAHLRGLYDERRPHAATQMVFRLGYARRGDAVTSPRIPVGDVLDYG
jgi:nitroreductase